MYSQFRFDGRHLVFVVLGHHSLLLSNLSAVLGCCALGLGVSIIPGVFVPVLTVFEYIGDSQKGGRHTEF